MNLKQGQEIGLPSGTAYLVELGHSTMAMGCPENAGVLTDSTVSILILPLLEEKLLTDKGDFDTMSVRSLKYNHSQREWERTVIMNMTELKYEVGDAISYYVNQVATKCSMEKDDAEQELTVVAWLSSMEYDEDDPEIDLKKFVITDIYFKSLHLIRDAHWHDKKKVINDPLMWPLFRTHSPNHADRIVEELFLEETFSDGEEREILSLRSQGYNNREIANMFDTSHQNISLHMNKMKKTFTKKSKKVIALSLCNV